MNILVVDIGTSSMRGILYREDGFKTLIEQIPYQPMHKGNGCVEQSPKDFSDALIKIVKAIAERSEGENLSVDAIALTSQRSSIAAVDRDGNPLSDFIMWQDTRNKELCNGLEQYNDLVYKRSGSKVNCVFSGGKMSWLRKERPELYKDIYKFTNIPEYLIHLMTGEYVSDFTYGSRSNMMNLEKCDWDDELLELFHIDREKLCNLKVPGAVSGTINKEFAALTGIKEGIPVISSGGDQQCASVGYGAFKEGVVSIVTGTGAYLTALSDGMPKNLAGDLICNYSAVEGKYILEGSVLTCCSAFDWYCNNFFDWEKPDYGWIEKELTKKYESGNPCVSLPYFQGRSTPSFNPDARATIHGISLATDRIDIMKSILEGIFIEIDNNIDCMKKYIEVEKAGVSGGLTHNKILNQIQSDIYGIPLSHLSDTETTANGAFMVAAKGLGLYDSMDRAFDQICKWTEVETYSPNSEKHAEYVKQKEEMNRLYGKIYG